MLLSPIAAVVIVLWLIGFAIAMAVARSPGVLAAGILSGLLFLPQFDLDNPGVVITKDVTLSIAAGLGALLIPVTSRMPFRIGRYDLPVIGFCLVGMASSISNQLGPYDGLCNVLLGLVVTAMPWFVGRTVFSLPANAVTLVRVTVLFALIYIPFCLFEMRMSPVLHAVLYGYSPRGGSDIAHAVRFGFWRPTVFMVIGLQLSLFMGISSVLAFWGYWSGRLTRLGPVSMLVIAAILGLVTLACVSTGAILLTILGWGIVATSSRRIGKTLLIGVAVFALTYPVLRMLYVGAFQVDVAAAGGEFAARQASLNIRIQMEDLFLEKWRQRPILGWTAWYFRDVGAFNICDSEWIATLGCYGLVGWICWSLIRFLPAVFAVRVGRHPGADRSPQVIMAVCILLSWLDSILNAFPTVLYLIMAGGAVGYRVQFHADPEAATRGHQPSSPRWPRRMWPFPGTRATNC